MKVIVACEESQRVTIAFRNKGHEAYSCDILPCSGGYPEWHIQSDVLKIINDGWDLMVAHPPCTFLTVTANKWLKEQPKRKSGKLVGIEREKARKEAIEFFMVLWNAPITKIAIENPIGCMNSILGKPNQIIHPYYFGDNVSKATCLWLKNLPKLVYQKRDDLFGKATAVEPSVYTSRSGKRYPAFTMLEACKIKNLDERARFRSVTFQGIANAMAEQWG
jgi:hypothetical protein